ncbi:MAG: hypothetical protein FK733_04385 [Asgard group archaeon]|nr:hypothetical protein [Asgard group archaeon]
MTDKDEKKVELTGLAKTIFDEVMDEVDEEIKDGFGMILNEAAMNVLIKNIQTAVKEKIVKLIAKSTKDDMTEVDKMVLGEKLARIVTKKAKNEFAAIVSEMVLKSYEVMYELRNEIIEEIFEETKIEEEDEDEEEETEEESEEEEKEY